MSLDDARRAIVGTPAKTFISAAFTLVIMLCGWTLKTTVDHSSGLSAIQQSIDDLKASIDSRDGEIDASLSKLSGDEQAQALAIARQDQEIADLEHARPEVRIEREAIPAPPVPPVVPQIGSAITHFLGIRGRGTRWRNNTHKTSR